MSVAMQPSPEAIPSSSEFGMPSAFDGSTSTSAARSASGSSEGCNAPSRRASTPSGSAAIARSSAGPSPGKGEGGPTRARHSGR